MFKPEFAELVRNGAKQQTVRPARKRPILVGQPLSLRRWEGSPYRSKQQVLRAAVVRNIWPISMALGDAGQLLLSVAHGTLADENAFARADGFVNIEEMRDWFRDTHGLPFSGVVISWAEEKR